MKVLLVVDPNSGVNLIGMTLAYYLRHSKSGKLDMLVKNENYKKMTLANLELSKKEYQSSTKINILGDESSIDQEYDLVIVEKHHMFESFVGGLDKFNKLILLRK